MLKSSSMKAEAGKTSRHTPLGAATLAKEGVVKALIYNMAIDGTGRPG
jgi:hypothetical protein